MTAPTTKDTFRWYAEPAPIIDGGSVRTGVGAFDNTDDVPRFALAQGTDGVILTPTEAAALIGELTEFAELVRDNT